MAGAIHAHADVAHEAKDTPITANLEPLVDKRIVYAWAFAALFWVTWGPWAGFFTSLKFNFPWLLGDSFATVYGAMRISHTQGVAYGWFSTGVLGFSHYMVPKLCGRPIWKPVLSWIGVSSWNLGMILGIGGIHLGYNQGLEFAEMNIVADVFVVIGLVSVVANLFMTIANRREPKIYVSLWYLMAGFTWTSINYLVGNFVAPLTTGANSAALNGFFLHNVVGLWVTPMGVAIVYYLLPVILKKPIASHKLSLLGFWTLAVIYPLGGSHHFFFSPMPWWLQVVAMPLTAALIFVVYSVVYNFFATMRGHWRELASNISLRFLTFGIFNYIVTCTQGPFHSLLTVQKVVHFTDWIVAHAHLALFGVFSWWLYAFIYWVWPRIPGRQLSRALGEWHFWLTFISFWLLYYIADTVAGLMQGFYWLSGQPLINSLEAAEPFWVSRAVSGVLLVAAAIIFVINLVRGQKGEPAHV